MRISDWSSDVCSSDLIGGKVDAKETRQPLDHRIGVVGPAVEDQRRYRIETVEQKMRVDLVVERLELGRLRHRAQLRRAPLLRARLETILHRQIEPDPRQKEPGPGAEGADHGPPTRRAAGRERGWQEWYN